MDFLLSSGKTLREWNRNKENSDCTIKEKSTENSESQSTEKGVETEVFSQILLAANKYVHRTLEVLNSKGS